VSRIWCLLAALCVVGVLMGAAMAAQPGPQETAARQWLGLVDAGEYAASWDEAAPYFQKAMEKDRWVKTMGAVREPLGVVKSRELAKLKERHALPRAPDGDYCLLLFDSSFAAKKTATELVTLQKTPDNRWRAVGYFIR